MAETEEALTPRGPWHHTRSTWSGGRRLNTSIFILTWVLLQTLVPTLWATHLRKLTGHSTLPHYWGERLTARDLHELLVNGGLEHAWSGFWTPLALLVLLFLIIWFGWRIQAGELGLKARWAPWGLGLLDTLVVGLLPLTAVAWALDQCLAWLGGMGIQGLAWMALGGRMLLPLCLSSALMVQWWLCRMSRAAEPAMPPFRRLREDFLALWCYPVQWAVLILASVLIRSLLQALPLLAGWQWGGGATGRVWALLLLQAVAAALNAWIIAWMLRLTARFWRGDATVRQAIADLRRDFALNRKDAGS
nr:hypothetical protein [uncultured Holophaga sp.]